MQVVLASRNEKKKKELQSLLDSLFPQIDVLTLDDIGMTDEIVENGSTFEENARLKALAVARKGYIGIGDDSGLSVRALNGEPGIFSARYAEIKGYGVGHNDALNNELLLKNMEGVEDRYAEFICAICCMFPDDIEHPIAVEGICEGSILTELHGESGFGYDPLFWVPSLGRTFAQLDGQEKNTVSHRGRAVRALAMALKRRYEV